MLVRGQEVQTEREEQRGWAERIHLHGDDASDVRPEDGQQEVDIYSEGKGKTSIRSRGLRLRGRIAAVGILSPSDLQKDDKRDDQHGADPDSHHQDLEQERICAVSPMRRQNTR